MPDWELGLPYSHHVASGGDVNGDGYDEILIGNGSTWSFDGRAWLFLGGPGGPGATSDWDATAQQPAEQFGDAVAFVGDLTGDGYDEVAVGAPRFDQPPFGNVGQLYIYEGSAIGIPWDAAPFTVTEGSINSGYFGSVITSGGDITGDGNPDTVVAGPNAYTSAGRVWVFDEIPAFSSLYAADFFACGADAWCGASLDAAGDVDGDGFGDLLVGAPHTEVSMYRQGALHLYLGGPFGVGTTPAWTAIGSTVNARMGFSVAGSLDLNGDAYPDLVVGARGYDFAPLAAGEVHVFLGGPGGPQATAAITLSPPTEPYSYYGAAVAAGDFDGDGLADFAVGAPRFDGTGSNQGCVHVYSSGAGWAPGP